MKQQSQPNATEMDTAVTRLDSRVDSLHEPLCPGDCFALVVVEMDLP